MALELKIGAVNTSPISLNYEELKHELAAKVEPYKGLIVTEDAIPTAKADLANIRRLMKALDDRRKEVKKEYEAPLKDFEAQIKDIISVANEAADNIDGQIKAFEKADDEKKLNRIKLFFNMAFGELAKVVPFERINNPKWLNKGYKKADIEAEISKMANDLRDNVDAVKALKSENEDALLRKLYLTLDMGEVMKEQAALNAIAEERKARELEAAKELSDAIERYRNCQDPGYIAPAPSQEPTEAFAVDTPEPVQVISFKVWVTEAQKVALRNFLVENGIRYGKA